MALVARKEPLLPQTPSARSSVPFKFLIAAWTMAAAMTIFAVFCAAPPPVKPAIAAPRFAGMDLLSAEGTVCEQETGGTCFRQQCNPWRNASCRALQVDLPGVGNTSFWWACRCDGGACAAGGRCQQRAEPATLRTRLRGDATWAALAAIAWVGRAGGYGWLMNVPGLQECVDGSPVSYSYCWSWDDACRGYQLTGVKPYALATFKLVFWHLGQAVLFIGSFVAYGGLMGWCQYIFAFLVLFKEICYLGIILIGVCTSPAFLVFSPFRETDLDLRAIFFFLPDVFVALHFAHEDLPWALFCLSCCSWPAMVVGLSGDGCMFPALAMGYLFNMVTPLVFAVRYVFS